MTLLQCYNKGCGKKFKSEDNSDDACEHHPGAPIFHDAYKGWSCCNKRSTDFTTFLNTKGCTKGRHNPEKPAEPEKPKDERWAKDEVITVEAPKRAPALPRPSLDAVMQRLPVTVAPSLKQALEKKKAGGQTQETRVEEECTEGGVKLGETCKNNGCKATYEGEHSSLEMCRSHPGIPIFHEGLKYWSCCQKKTTEFTDFLEQLGCTTTHHCWVKLTKQVAAACRYDWHQTATHVCIAIYAKMAQPATSYVEANPIRLNVNITFGEDSVFTMDTELRGVIDVERSSVTLAAPKVEIKLRKAEPSSWRTLYLEAQDQQQASHNKTDDQKVEEGELEQRVEAVDLSDL